MKKATPPIASIIAGILLALSAGCLQDGVQLQGLEYSTAFVRGSIYLVSRGGLEGYEMQVLTVYNSEGDTPPPRTGLRHWIIFKTKDVPPHASIVLATLKCAGESPWYESTKNEFTRYQWYVTEWERIR